MKETEDVVITGKGNVSVPPIWLFIHEERPYTIFDIPEGYTLDNCEEKRGKLHVNLKKVI